MGQIVLGLHVVGIMAVRADQHAVLRFLGQHPARVQPVVALAVHLRIAIEIGLEPLRPFHALNSQKIFFGQLAEHRHLAQVDLAGHPLDVSADLYAVVVHRDARHLARVVFLQIDLDVGIELFLTPLPLGLQPGLFPLFLRIGSQPGIADTHRRRPRRIRNDQQAQINRQDLAASSAWSVTSTEKVLHPSAIGSRIMFSSIRERSSLTITTMNSMPLAQK